MISLHCKVGPNAESQQVKYTNPLKKRERNKHKLSTGDMKYSNISKNPCCWKDKAHRAYLCSCRTASGCAHKRSDAFGRKILMLPLSFLSGCDQVPAANHHAHLNGFSSLQMHLGNCTLQPS